MIVSQGVAKFHLATTPHDQWGSGAYKMEKPNARVSLYIPIINIIIITLIANIAIIMLF